MSEDPLLTLQLPYEWCLECTVDKATAGNIETVCVSMQARQQVQEMVWMKQSENMVLEAMTRLSTVHDALEELLMGSVMSQPQTADANVL